MSQYPSKCQMIPSVLADGQSPQLSFPITLPNPQYRKGENRNAGTCVVTWRSSDDLLEKLREMHAALVVSGPSAVVSRPPIPRALLSVLNGQRALQLILAIPEY